MSTEVKKQYTRRTYAGYFAMGLASMILGLVYNTLPYFLSQSGDEKLFIGIDVLVFGLIAIVPSFLFYKVFFDIHKGLSSVSKIDIKKLREKIQTFKKAKKEKSNEKFGIEDFISDETNGDTPTQNEINALEDWFYAKEKCYKSLLLYLAIICSVSIFLIILWRTTSSTYPLTLFAFFISYSAMYLIACSFYTILFNNYRVESFQRISYSIFYPTVATIAVNMFFGLSLIDFRKQDFSVMYPLFVFLAFFLLISLFEMISYSPRIKKNSGFSTGSFVIISIVLVGIPGILFLVSHNNSPFSNFLFSILLSLFLSIFEGWDGLRRMNLSDDSTTFIHHYKWWTAFQVGYPILMFAVISVVNSSIFTLPFLIGFSVISFISILFWNSGGMERYSNTNWSKLKIRFGLSVIGIIFFSEIMYRANLNDSFQVTEISIVELIGLFSLSGITILFTAWQTSRREIINEIFFRPFTKTDPCYSDIIKYTSKGHLFIISMVVYAFATIVFDCILFGISHMQNTKIITTKSSLSLICLNMMILSLIVAWLIRYVRYKKEQVLE